MLRRTHRLRLPRPLAVAAAEAQRLKAVDKQLVVAAAPLPRAADRRLAVAQVAAAVAPHRKAEARLQVGVADAAELQLPLLRRNSPMAFT